MFNFFLQFQFRTNPGFKAHHKQRNTQTTDHVCTGITCEIQTKYTPFAPTQFYSRHPLILYMDIGKLFKLTHTVSGLCF